MKKNKDVMDTVIKVLSCEKQSNLPTSALESTRLLDDIERGSISLDMKANSLLGRWFKKDEIKILKVEEEND